MRRLPQSFYTARVAEALNTLASYVYDAYKLTEEIKPAEGSNPPVGPDPDEIPHSPDIDDADPPPPDKRAQTVAVKRIIVSGEHLEHVKEFILIPLNRLGDSRNKAKTLTNVSKKGFTAEFGSAIPKGDYLAWVKDKFGQEALHRHVSVP